MKCYFVFSNCVSDTFICLKRVRLRLTIRVPNNKIDKRPRHGGRFFLFKYKKISRYYFLCGG